MAFKQTSQATLLGIVAATCLLLGVAAYFAWDLYLKEQQNKMLDRSSVGKYAVITATDQIQQLRYYFVYSYVVDDTTYESGKIRWYPDKQYISTGDSCLIEYAQSDPSVSRPVATGPFTFEVKRPERNYPSDADY